MSDFTALRVGANNGGTDKKELFLKVWSGEVLTAFEETNVVMDKHLVRQITSGKSAAFPATWKVNASYHTPGAEIAGQGSNVGERNIAIDDLLVAPVFIPNIDEAMNHFDYRSIYSKEAGNALANAWDKNVLQVMALAARASATVTGAYGGTQLTSATTLYKTSATDLEAGISAACQAMDEKDIPDSEERFAFLRPAQFYLLANTPGLVDKDYSQGNGDYAKRKIVYAGGARLVKTNHLPITNITTGPAAYQGDFTKTAAVVTTKGAAGTVKLLDLATEMEYTARHQGTLIVSKYAVGHGICRPECAVELRTTT